MSATPQRRRGPWRRRASGPSAVFSPDQVRELVGLDDYGLAALLRASSTAFWRGFALIVILDQMFA